MNTVEWVKSHELYTGGIEAWDGAGKAYPEVTGYLIPTLWEYKQVSLCNRLAKWLIGKQQPDGGFLGLDDKQHVFDTSAIFQGLQHLYNRTRAVYLIEPLIKAERFILHERTDEGYFRRYKRSDNEPYLYLCRTSGILQDKKSLDYWEQAEWIGKQQRPHYIAYALEGMRIAGRDNVVIAWLQRMKRAILSDGFMPFYVDRNFNGSSSDTTATCQFAILYHQYGMLEYAEMLKQAAETVLQPDGGLWHDKQDKRCISWAAKYYLDLYKEMP